MGYGVPMMPGIDSFGTFASGAQSLDMMQNIYNSSGAVDPMSADIGLLSMGSGVSPNATFNVTGNATADPLTGGFFGSKLSQLYYTDPEKYYEELQKINKSGLKNDQALRGALLDANLQDKHDQARVEFQANSKAETVQRRIGELQEAIQKNDQKNILYRYQRLRADVAAMLIEEGAIDAPKDKDGKQLTQFGDYNGLQQQEISTRAQEEYAKATGGHTLTKDLEQYGDSEFVHGIKEGLGFGTGIFTNSDKSAKDNKVDITGIDDRTNGDEATKWTGRIAGGLLTGFGLIIALPLAVLALKGGIKGTAIASEWSWGKLFSKGAKLAEKGAEGLAKEAGHIKV